MKHNNHRIRVEEETITVERAGELLQRVKNVRKVRPDHVHSLAEAIREGMWDLNGSTIKIDRSGALIDGEHRLRACIQAQKPIKTLVAYGIESSTTIDTGARPRTAMQIFRSKGTRYAGWAVGIARLALLLEQDGNLLRIGYGSLKLNLTVQRITDYAEKRMDKLERAARISHPVACITHLPAAALGLIAYQSPDSPTMQAFMEALRTGEGLRRGNPAYALRERALNAGKHRLHNTDACAIVFKAWNAYVRKEPMSMLKWIGINEKIQTPLIAT